MVNTLYTPLPEPIVFKLNLLILHELHLWFQNLKKMSTNSSLSLFNLYLDKVLTQQPPSESTTFGQADGFLHQYFINNEPRTWNFGRYKQHAQQYCLDNSILSIHTKVYSTSWVGFLQEFYHDDNQNSSKVPIVWRMLGPRERLGGRQRSAGTWKNRAWCAWGGLRRVCWPNMLRRSRRRRWDGGHSEEEWRSRGQPYWTGKGGGPTSFIPFAPTPTPTPPPGPAPPPAIVLVPSTPMEGDTVTSKIRSPKLLHR